MPHICASEDYVTRQASGAGRGSRVASERSYRVPTGTVHAFRAGDDEAVCGLPAEGLHAFPNMPWAGGDLNRCGHCLRAAPLSAEGVLAD
ncbi:MAG: hypothetical protein QOE45_3462 [Frankiaceae bacterium]|jgi:hypothetical protein|nr:hypothetical protein [Frankiaceae bacterium]